MINVIKLAAKNLMRYRRRTLLTSLLITLGIVFVLLFISLSGSFKSLMIGQITDSMLGHLQVHKKGYVASLESLPLNLNMKPEMVKKVEKMLKETGMVESYSPRIKFGAMFSNFKETSNVRLTAVFPDKETKTCPLLTERIIEGERGGKLVKKGHILIPELLAKGMKVKLGDTIVIVATNKDGSVNGKTFIVQAILEGISGPGGRDGYIHIEDARGLLRIAGEEVSEIAVRLTDNKLLERAFLKLKKEFSGIKNQKGKPVFELHTWKKLTPFINIAKMIDLMTYFIKIMLVAVVAISIMNVMIMAVYERIREIGTMAAMGTRPGKITGLFLLEGFLLGVAGTAIGTAISLFIIYILNIYKLTYSFGRQQNLPLEPVIGAGDVFMVCGIVIVVAVLASVQPAWKASKMDPITALRHV